LLNQSKLMIFSLL